MAFDNKTTFNSHFDIRPKFFSKSDEDKKRFRIPHESRINKKRVERAFYFVQFGTPFCGFGGKAALAISPRSNL